jgi:hypothetical protein
MTDYDGLTKAREQLRAMSVDTLNGLADVGTADCPVCSRSILEITDYDTLEKVQSWTVAQLLAWTQLQERSDVSVSDLMAQTSEQARPGIGALASPTVLGVTVNDIFVGIELDGYTHS